MYGGGKKLSKPKTQNTSNLFLLKKKKKEIKGRIIRDIWTLFETKEVEKERKKVEKKEEINNRLIKDRIIRDIRTHFAQEEDYYKPKRVSNFWNNNYIEYESNGDKNRNLSLGEYLNKIEPYLRNIMIDLQNSDTWKIQLTIAINFTSSNDVDEERVIHSSTNNIELASCNDENEIIDDLFKPLRSRYQGNLETAMKESDFIFDSVQLMYYKCHKVNFNRGGL